MQNLVMGLWNESFSASKHGLLQLLIAESNYSKASHGKPNPEAPPKSSKGYRANMRETELTVERRMEAWGRRMKTLRRLQRRGAMVVCAPQTLEDRNSQKSWNGCAPQRPCKTQKQPAEAELTRQKSEFWKCCVVRTLFKVRSTLKALNLRPKDLQKL